MSIGRRHRRNNILGYLQIHLAGLLIRRSTHRNHVIALTLKRHAASVKPEDGLSFYGGLEADGNMLS
ncbi:MAG: hypothetical protein A2Y91_06400 [Chloroflexi bacterium RBG_13_54_8]|nr:MAG: hypothetical protein A2Y91_06400 [Chloroflexi bacterium RBG_13_54_8]